MIYLDYAANTPADDAVLNSFMLAERELVGNPNSHHPAGEAARQKLAGVTEKIAELLGVLPSEIIYTSGASEANNLAVKGIALAHSQEGRHILTTPLAHPSVRGPLAWLRTQGFEVEMLQVGRGGQIDLAHLKAHLRSDTVLLAVTAVDSELGAVQQMSELIEIIKDFPHCRLHADATQAMGKIPFSLDGLHTASLSAHKFHGLNGSGLLFRRQGVTLEPLIHGSGGGGGEGLYRSGTPTVALACALRTALELSLGSLEKHLSHVSRLNHRLREALAAYPLVRFNSPPDAVPHILNLSVAGTIGTRWQRMLGERGVCVSVKSACAADGAPSEAVLAVSGDRRNALSSWRISLDHETTDAELTEFLAVFDQCYRALT